MRAAGAKRGTSFVRQGLAAVLVLVAIEPESACAQPPGKTGGVPLLELRPGERYFRVDGTPAFVLGRNPAGRDTRAYDERFRRAAEAGERLVRLHLAYSPPQEKAGTIDAGVLEGWDHVLDAAEAHGLAVLPVLGVWSDWNDGSRGETWHAWDDNPFNARRGGPASGPAQLFEESACRSLWLQRLDILVRHWAPRRVIIGWEFFTELDLVTGANEDRAVAFAERAAAVIRAADPQRRPVTASLAGVNEWPRLLKSPALDFVEVHPYTGGKYAGRLDELILSSVRQRLETYGKPVLIGECGLDAAPPRGTLDAAPRAAIGIRHAIWAAVVSGAMNGRMLWWQDGYDQFEKASFSRYYDDAATRAAAFVHGLDFSGFAPILCQTSPGLKGALLGNDRLIVGWFRDTDCLPPDWPVRNVAEQHVAFRPSGTSWRVEYIDPASGTRLGQRRLAPLDNRLQINLPTFQGSIAIRLRRLAP